MGRTVIKTGLFFALLLFMNACSSAPINLRIKADVAVVGAGSAVDEGVYSGSELESLRAKNGSDLEKPRESKVLVTLDFNGQRLNMTRSKARADKFVLLDLRSESFTKLKAVKITVLVPGVGRVSRWYQAQGDDTDLNILAVIRDKSR
jgi:hypothetical protein